MLGKPFHTYRKQFIKGGFYNLKVPIKINHITNSYINSLSNLKINDDGEGWIFI